MKDAETDKGDSRLVPRAGNNVLRLQDRHVCAAKRRTVPDDADGAGGMKGQLIDTVAEFFGIMST